MKKLFLPFTVILFIAACAPRDVAKDSGKSNSANKTVTYFADEVGQTSETCTGKNWGVLEIPQSDEEGIFAGKIKAVLLAGNLNCFKIGSRVEVKYNRNDQEVLGFAKIKSTEGLLNSKLNKGHALMFDMTVTDLKERGKNLIEAAKFDAANMVTVTTFELEGLEDIPAEDTTVVEAKTIFSEDGERPTTCSEGDKDWSFITAPLGMDMSGTIMAVVDRGDKNCLRIGSEVQVKYKAADGSTAKSEDRVKIVAVEIIPSSYLGYAYSQIFSMTLDAAKAYYAQTLAHGTVSVVYFSKSNSSERVASSQSTHVSL